MSKIATCIIVFIFLGPPIAFLAALHDSDMGVKILIGLPLAYIFSPAAAFAGMLHGTACWLIIKFLPFRRIDPIAGAVIGMICGYLAVQAAGVLLNQSMTNPRSDFYRLVTGGILAGGLCSLLIHIKWPYQK